MCREGVKLGPVVRPKGHITPGSRPGMHSISIRGGSAGHLRGISGCFAKAGLAPVTNRGRARECPAH